MVICKFFILQVGGSKNIENVRNEVEVKRMIFFSLKIRFCKWLDKRADILRNKNISLFLLRLGLIHSFQFKKPWDQHLSNTLLWSKLKKVWNLCFGLRRRTKTIEGRCFLISNSLMAQLLFLGQITAHLLASISDICCCAACWDFPKQKFYAALYH